jgi:KTSC domain
VGSAATSLSAIFTALVAIERARLDFDVAIGNRSDAWNFTRKCTGPLLSRTSLSLDLGRIAGSGVGHPRIIWRGSGEPQCLDFRLGLSRGEYEPGDSSLVVHFMNGTLYKYLKVPQATFDALMRAPSKGRFFNDNIKDKFQFVRM